MRYIFSTLNLYFCRVFLSWFGVASIAIMSVVSLFEATEYARRAVGRPNIDTATILEMVFLKLPQHFEMLFPYMILLTTVITFWRIHQTSELIVARTAGISIWQFTRGLLAMIMALCILDLTIFNPLAAAMTSRLQNMEAIIFSGQENRLAISETGLWLREVTDDTQRIIHARSANLKDAQFFDVSVYHFDDIGSPNRTIHARQAFLTRGEWQLDGVIDWQGAHLKTHETITLPTNLSLKKIQEGNLAPQSLSFWQIPDYIQILDKSGLSTIGYRLCWHAHLAKIALALALVLLGVAFSLRHPLRGINFWGIAWALSLGFVVYFLKDVVYALGLGDKIPTILAAWSPPLITALLAATLILHYEDSSPA